ncbi:nicotinate-nucleotide pyrophosphorylase [carboxylating]-like isoform X2 [Gigantopelta aegis]|uniref:nicotinate-nucleotide pyrophosphorylase [carboxylating]-like isoform X2 n=1 Tax=Gigantopelta aegis TaxID=1735272 RepID=UPI001B88C635|nr:nicotinate-nucleotide pyrophosphorylase [carboxylating]-like isoform X2 [Gigantopelta aegis]
MTTQKNKCDSILSGIYSNRYSHILTPTNLKHLAREWLKEDTPSFDYAGFVVGEKEETAVLLVKSPGVVAGRPFFDAIFEELDCKVEWDCEEGEHIENVRTVAKVTGKVRHLLLGERVALNCLARASGIATYARKLKRIVEGVEWKGEVAGTRKTTPGFRMVEKYALLVGGVATHRHDLSSMVMLKDNHIWTAGNVAQAAVKSAAILKEQFPRLIIEASGGITESTITKYCDKNVDVISVSKLVQGYDIVDFSMKITKAGRDPHNPTVHI